MWEETVTCFVIVLQDLPRWTEENYKNKIRIFYFNLVSLKYHLIIDETTWRDIAGNRTHHHSCDNLKSECFPL
jgi:hypothetical protein